MVWAPAACRISCRASARVFINQKFDNHFLDTIARIRRRSRVSRIWVPARVGFGGNRTGHVLIMRGALHDNVRVLHRFYHVRPPTPRSATCCSITHESHPRGRRRVRHQHLEAMSRIEGIEVVSLVGRDPKATAEVASTGRFRTSPPSCPRAWPRRGSKPRCWRRQRRCTRAGHRMPSGGKHVMIEIPIADSLADSQRVWRRSAQRRPGCHGRATVAGSIRAISGSTKSASRPGRSRCCKWTSRPTFSAVPT